MSCSVCHGHPGCPVCNDCEGMETCQDCNGTGIISYLNEEGEAVTKEEWEKLPVNSRYTEDCENCDGEGWVTYEYEPEYEHEDE